MTTLQYSKEGDTFHVSNEGRAHFVQRNQFFEKFTDWELINAGRQAIEKAPDVVAVVE